MGTLYDIKSASRAGPQATPRQEKLTPRQLEVLALLCEGLPNKLIARRLDMASGTVKVHVVRILRALSVANRLQAVIEAGRLGLLDKPGGNSGTLNVTVVASRSIRPVAVQANGTGAAGSAAPVAKAERSTAVTAD